MNELVSYQSDQVLATYDDVEKAAKAMAGSGFFQDTKQASQAIVKILAAREIGFGPFAGMTGINIIQGKPAFGANIMAAAVKRSGRYNYRVTEMTDKACTIEFMEFLGGKWVQMGVSGFTSEDARKAGTKNLDKFPRNMLFARAMSNGVRWYCPDVMNGSTIYTPEELGAEIDQDGEVISGTVITTNPTTWEPIEPKVQQEAPQLDPNLGADWIMAQAEGKEKVAEPEKPVKAQNGKFTRPMSPETLKEALAIRAKTAKPASEKQTALVRILLLEYFAGREDERHQAQEYLTGKRSLNEMDPKIINALLDWMKPEVKSDGSGAYVINQMSAKELSAVANKFMADLGQESLI